MGRGHEDHATMAVNSSSSIALLQERFRRLQREKQMREERELRRGDSSVSPVHLEAAANNLFFHPEVMMSNISLSSPSPPLSPDPHVGLSLWPNELGTASRVGGRSLQHRKERPPMVTNVWPRGRDTRIPNVVHGHASGRPQDDIDTSLHL